MLVDDESLSFFGGGSIYCGTFALFDDIFRQRVTFTLQRYVAENLSKNIDGEATYDGVLWRSTKNYCCFENNRV